MNTLRLNIPIPTGRPASSGAPTRRSSAVAASLGFALDEPLGAHLPPAPPGPEPITIAPRSITLVRGPSGSGKSTLLRWASESLRAQGARIIAPPTCLPDIPAIDLIDADLDQAMVILARAGLAEAACFVRRPRELSDGQRERLRLAMMFDRAANTTNAPTIFILDEFAASLDPLTARAVAILLRRFVMRSRAPLAALVSTPRADLLPWLAPDAIIHLSATGAPTTTRPIPSELSDPLADVRIERADRADYFALAPLHYRARQPATIVHALRAVHVDPHTAEETLAGVLVISMPPLNARWRSLAWPGRYNTPDKSTNTRRINAELRVISRVIIDPRFRSLALATRLVRHYLNSPWTPCTEAVAAMGAAAPFFERAGMTPYPLAPSERDARLLDALVRCHIEPHMLATPDAALQRALSADIPHSAQFIERELRLWARDSRASRSLADAPIRQLFRVAASSVACLPTAYAHATSSNPSAS